MLCVEAKGMESMLQNGFCRQKKNDNHLLKFVIEIFFCIWKDLILSIWVANEKVKESLMLGITIALIF